MSDAKAIVPVEWPATAVLLGDLLLVVGDARPLGDLHSCDEMGCGSVGDHVLVRPPQKVDGVAQVVALSPDQRKALLVALLRACPNEAPAAVDECKVARPWNDGTREALGRPPRTARREAVAEVAYNGFSRGWYVDHPAPAVHQEYDGGSAAEAAADTALLADGWLLAGEVGP